MTTPIVPSISDEQLAEIEAAADAFPDYEWDSNTEPFFNGPSGESLGGGSTGFYSVYGQPFEIDDEVYDGPTLVEACPLSEAKFICKAKPTIKSLIARLRAAEADLKAAHQRIKELDLLFGRYLLGMKSAVIEMDHGRGAKAAMQWIINGLEGPGELPPEDELDAQAFFDREIKPINDAMAELFEARRAAMERTP